jgi:pyridoxal 5'-phosphate synthase pdxS subunit
MQISPPPHAQADSLHSQARIAEEAGACAVMALERVPADIRVEGGVARMSDPKMIKEIMATVTIPVMAKARIGHFVECQVRSLDSYQVLE